nr:rwd domain-containing protein [Quercus suber]
MGLEEQREEREVLDSIFPDEIHDVNDTEYRISITLDLAPEPSADDDDEPANPTILLIVRYPPDYPDVAPMLDISQPPNAAKHPHLDIQDDKGRLLAALQPSIEESLGMAMVFTLVSTLKDAAELLVLERQQAVQAVLDVEKAKAEEEENRKFEGEKVTRETFLAWRERFNTEMRQEAERKVAEQEAEDKKKRVKVEEKKLTGKQLWEQGLAGKVIDDEEEDGEDAVESLKTLTVAG